MVHKTVKGKNVVLKKLVRPHEHNISFKKSESVLEMLQLSQYLGFFIYFCTIARLQSSSIWQLQHIQISVNNGGFKFHTNYYMDLCLELCLFSVSHVALTAVYMIV